MFISHIPHAHKVTCLPVALEGKRIDLDTVEEAEIVLRREGLQWFGHVRGAVRDTKLGVLQRLEVEGRR